MQNADAVLEIIRKRGERGLPLTRVYRLLFNRDLFLLAYGRIARNTGALTRGVTAETADGMSLAKIDAIIEALRFERYRWTPVRRTYIPKASGKRRRLGIPTWSDKLVQEVIRLILDAYYDPQFSDRSHGFRAGRGCHTALTAVYEGWKGTAWFIEGDIAQYFDRLDHEVLLATLREKIHDGRFVGLIGGLLRAGYLEDWRFNTTLSGTPQGGVASPVLASIYLDRFDTWVETTLLPAHNRGAKRAGNAAYCLHNRRAWRLDRRGHHAAARAERAIARRMPSQDPDDPDYRRLRYVRYADDFLLGFAGPRSEAEEIKRQVGQFLREQLKLELADDKTLITHARTEAARFLGYEVHVIQDDTARSKTGRRKVNGVIGLRVPVEVRKSRCARFMARGKPLHRPELLADSAFSTVARYQQEFRGVVNYYRLADNVCKLSHLKWVMETSLTKTLAAKLRISVPKVYRRFGTTLQTPLGPYKGLRVVVERGPARKPLVAEWGGIPLRRDMGVPLDDDPARVWNARTELEQRLCAGACELCGSCQDIDVHHIRALKDLNQRGRAQKPAWVKAMATRQRKTLVVCRRCHADIHAGRQREHSNTDKTLESRMR
jgi:group II intron reverse transcriptase/maturase